MADIETYFEQSQLWGRPPEAYQLGVRRDILNLVGNSPTSVLDVGCGDGIITNVLPNTMRVVGLDSSREALKHVGRETVHATAGQIPFENAAFDLVMANDLLEHLAPADLPRALVEIQRVAKRWILITVPFMESIPSGMTRCGACGCIYHVNQHHRAFGVQELRQLFPWRSPALMVFSGADVNSVETIQRHLRAQVGVLNHWDMATCPECGQRASVGSSARISALVDRAANQWAPLIGAQHPDRSECIAVYSLDGTLPAKLACIVDSLSVQCEPQPPRVFT